MNRNSREAAADYDRKEDDDLDDTPPALMSATAMQSISNSLNDTGNLWPQAYNKSGGSNPMHADGSGDGGSERKRNRRALNDENTLDDILGQITSKLTSLTTKEDTDQEERINAFVSVLNCSNSEASFYLESATWNVETAVMLWLENNPNPHYYNSGATFAYSGGFAIGSSSSGSSSGSGGIDSQLQGSSWRLGSMGRPTRYVEREVRIPDLPPDWRAWVSSLSGQVMFTHIPTGLQQNYVPPGYADVADAEAESGVGPPKEGGNDALKVDSGAGAAATATDAMMLTGDEHASSFPLAKASFVQDMSDTAPNGPNGARFTTLMDSLCALESREDRAAAAAAAAAAESTADGLMGKEGNHTRGQDCLSNINGQPRSQHSGFASSSSSSSSSSGINSGALGCYHPTPNKSRNASVRTAMGVMGTRGTDPRERAQHTQELAESAGQEADDVEADAEAAGLGPYMFKSVARTRSQICTAGTTGACGAVGSPRRGSDGMGGIHRGADTDEDENHDEIMDERNISPRKKYHLP